MGTLHLGGRRAGVGPAVDGATTVPVNLVADVDEGRRRGDRHAVSGVRPLQDAQGAFAARVALIRAARRTLDVQYYIWHADLSGSLLLAELEAAAGRGVRVRLLLDDNGIAGMDSRLAAASERPNIMVRLYNPFTIRHPKAINWLFAFSRLNRRMHAKSLTADRRLTIVGGRNIGDEYFGAKAEGLFDDLDVLAVGPAVDEVAQVFERHWHSPGARPAEKVFTSVTPTDRHQAIAHAAKKATSPPAERYRQAVRALPLAEDMSDGDLDLIGAPARAVAVGPDERGEAARTCGLAQLLPQGLGEPSRELIIISGYLVPTREGCDDLAELARNGVAVRLLTNSFAATDVGLVHAGYAPRRRPLLKAGVELFEMPAPGDRPKTARTLIRPGSTKARKHSGHSLHAKTYIVDRRRLYIGSANFDPRSAYLNTELGLVIESPPLARAMAQAFERAAQNSYRVTLGENGGLRWTDFRDDDPQPEMTEPGTTLFTRSLIALLARLPVERYL